ncbi:hypothetical protein [Mangrovivirga cuniculi]|uniref:DUF3592 domain-containing protein n=1 Tax=Mangrovivirga cuniculi TaxID=2715131 RepID=A0A4D7JRP2_9BACT|nr:hypothetical protein [Mangrovivirga cuniculi]QCK14486.1 hypothetical protein DCC35_06895 [Mangrovivirga cuniculi]
MKKFIWIKLFSIFLFTVFVIAFTINLIDYIAYINNRIIVKASIIDVNPGSTSGYKDYKLSINDTVTSTISSSEDFAIDETLKVYFVPDYNSVYLINENLFLNLLLLFIGILFTLFILVKSFKEPNFVKDMFSLNRGEGG